MAEMTLEDAARVLTKYGHHDLEWVAIDGREVGVVAVGIYRKLGPLEARAIAREYLRLDGKLPGPATRDVLDDIAAKIRQAKALKKQNGGPMSVGVIHMVVRVDAPAFLAEREND